MELVSYCKSVPLLHKVHKINMPVRSNVSMCLFMCQHVLFSELHDRLQLKLLYNKLALSKLFLCFATESS